MSRTLEEDKEILKKKIREAAAYNSTPENQQQVRVLRKRLKRVQRKLRSIERQRSRAST